MSDVLKKRATRAKKEVLEAKEEEVKKIPTTAIKKREAKAEAKADAIAQAKSTGSGSIEVMLAQTYDPERDDPSGWLMSEKMDGVRCYWNGSTMYTRTGKLFFPPKSWKEQLPSIALDGELWSGRDDF